MAGGSLRERGGRRLEVEARRGVNSSMWKSRSIGSVGSSRISRRRRLTAAFSSPASVSSAWAASIKMSATSGSRSFMTVESYHEAVPSHEWCPPSPRCELELRHGRADAAHRGARRSGGGDRVRRGAAGAHGLGRARAGYATRRSRPSARAGVQRRRRAPVRGAVDVRRAGGGGSAPAAARRARGAVPLPRAPSRRCRAAARWSRAASSPGCAGLDPRC